jgi:hypothetical protein
MIVCIVFYDEEETDDEYATSTIDGVFTSRKRALDYIEYRNRLWTKNKGSYHIEECELNHPLCLSTAE